MSIPFAHLLREEMQRQGVTVVSLAATLGVSKDTISAIRAGRKEPRHALALRIADALACDGLATISVRDRTGSCDLCGMTYVDAGTNRRRRYCSLRCQQLGWLRHEKGERRQVERVARRRLTSFQAAVTAYCRECEPEGACRTPTCALRPVSPLPLVAA